MNSAELQQLLDAVFPEADVRVASPDGVHFSARIVAADFVGLSRVARHQRVYGALGTRMGGEIHALSLETLSPEEA